MANTVKTSKKTNKKSVAKKIPHVYKERNPDNHKITGKFTVLYVLFAVTTLIFAALSVYLFVFSTNVLNKYEEIDAMCRSGNCKVVVVDYDDVEDEE